MPGCFAGAGRPFSASEVHKRGPFWDSNTAAELLKQVNSHPYLLPMDFRAVCKALQVLPLVVGHVNRSVRMSLRILQTFKSRRGILAGPQGAWEAELGEVIPG